MERKSQAAMEFLMTYGWAILAAVVVIGVLAYFGVFSPSRYAPSVCVLNAPFGCDEYSIAAANVRMIIRNGAGESVDISSVDVRGCATATTGWINPIADGDTVDITVTCATALSGKFKGDVTITYMKTGGTISQTATGSVSGTVA